MIGLHQVSKVYPSGDPALHQVTCSLLPGDLVFLSGPSGAGKTTLLKILMGQEKPTSGSITVHGDRLDTMKPKALHAYRKQVGIVTQQPQWIEGYNVLKNVGLPLELLGYERSFIERRVHAALSKVALQGFERRDPMHLSAGEQQRLTIARAIVHSPQWLFADEPTGSLDPHLARDIIELMTAFSSVGVTVVIATHDHSLWQGRGNRVLLLERGQLVDTMHG